MTTPHLSTAAKLTVLSRCDVFARIPSDALGVLAEMMEAESLGGDDLLFETGEPSDRVFVVHSGSLTVHVGSRAEPVRTLG
ncbi:MAG: hypothetical protein JRI68_35985, partial [Deltaproteobacteria bacterium]|nr:hypothetical protein [Deltaproteobacteria bacterium]